MKTDKRANQHRSIFFHLVMVLIVTVVIINATVFAFFRLSGPPVSIPWHRHLERYAAYLAEELGENPGSEMARLKAGELSRELKIDMAFYDRNNTGKDTSWKTSPDVPSLEVLEEDLEKNRAETEGGRKARAAHAGHCSGGFFKIVEYSNGSLVFWIEGPDWWTRSTRHIVVIIVFFSVILVAAAWTLRRLLRPVKEMEKAFSELAKGSLDTRMRLSGPREFQSASAGFNSMVERITEMLHSRDRLLRDMSHEFRSPLARIRIALGMMPESPGKDAVKEDVLEMEALVTDILEAYRFSEKTVDQGNLGPVEAFEIKDVLSLAVTKVKRAYPHSQYSENYEKSPVKIMGNKKQITRLFSNLIENAARYMDTTGRITVSLSFLTPGNFVSISVCDEGPGIPEDLREKIFEPFYRIEEARTRGTGYGLGLFLCREIASMHGGRIIVKPNTPRGSIFEVILPLV